MAHEFESGLTVGLESWHGLETNVQAPIGSVREALEIGAMNWTVSEEPVYRLADDGTPIRCADHKAIVRDSDKTTLGVVGKGFRPVQNVEAFSPFDALLESGLVSIDTAGSLREGKRVYMSCKISDQIAEVLPGDIVEGNLLCFNGHDGSLRLGYKRTATRVVCANTLKAALGSGSDALMFHHRSGVDRQIDRLKEAFAKMGEAFTKDVDSFKAMASRSTDPREFFRGLLRATRKPVDPESPEDTEGEDKGHRTMAQLLEAYEVQPGRQFAPGTAWQAFNAVTYFVDHMRSRSKESGLNASWFGEGATLRAKAHELALAA